MVTPDDPPMAPMTPNDRRASALSASSADGSTRAWSYEEALAWLYGRQALGIKLGLAKVEKLLAALGDPHKSFQSVHVGGTNGKGSVCRMMAGVLQRAGYRTGLTTSPHLVSFVERIEVDGVAIVRTDVAAGLAQIRAAVAPLDAAGEAPTFFECVTALAFLHFRTAGVRWAVVEVGMGGRLDATNVLTPAITIITNVEVDHTTHLGPTVADIAWEKAGIMKPGVPLVTSASGQGLFVLKARSHDLRVPMSVLGEDYQIVPEQDDLIILRPNGESHYRVGLAGAHQKRNAALVAAACGALRGQGVRLPESAVHDALANTTHAGRLETFHVPAGRFGPATMEVLIDGAHNPDAAHALRRHLGKTGWGGFHLVAGFCADKDWTECVDQWVPLASRVWCVPVRSSRSLDPGRLAQHIEPSGIPAMARPDVAAALAAAGASGVARVLVAGSLFLAGEARALLLGQPLEEIRGTQ